MKRNAVVFFWRSVSLEFFRASLGKFGQKSFAPPKMCLLLHLCCQILALFLLRSFALFIVPDDITGFGVAVAKTSFSVLSFYESTD